jgi:hypothetical protein
MVGDRSHDVEGAAQHGIDTVVVDWGYGGADFDGFAVAHVADVAQLREGAECPSRSARDVHLLGQHLPLADGGEDVRPPDPRTRLAERVRVSSAGTGHWHVGEGADRRARKVLAANGYPVEHRVAQIGDDHLAADLVIALGRNHFRFLREAGRRRPGPDAGRSTRAPGPHPRRR